MTTEREEFERYWESLPSDQPEGSELDNSCHYAAWSAWQTARASAIPNGWAEEIHKALHLAYHLGQNYCQQGDSDFVSQNDKAAATQLRFHDLVDKIADLLAASPKPAEAKNKHPRLLYEVER